MILKYYYLHIWIFCSFFLFFFCFFCIFVNIHTFQFILCQFPWLWSGKRNFVCLNVGGYNGSSCATHSGLCVPVIPVQTVPVYWSRSGPKTVRFVPVIPVRTVPLWKIMLNRLYRNQKTIWPTNLILWTSNKSSHFILTGTATGKPERPSVYHVIP